MARTRQREERLLKKLGLEPKQTPPSAEASAAPENEPGDDDETGDDETPTQEGEEG